MELKKDRDRVQNNGREHHLNPLLIFNTEEIKQKREAFRPDLVVQRCQTCLKDASNSIYIFLYRLTLNKTKNQQYRNHVPRNNYLTLRHYLEYINLFQI